MCALLFALVHEATVFLVQAVLGGLGGKTWS